MRVTDAIRGEHAAMRPLIRYLRDKTKPGVNISRDLIICNSTALAMTVAAHAKLEEDLLFKCFPSVKPVKHAMAEHKQLDLLFDKASTGDKTALHNATKLLLGHFDEEERDIFQFLDKVLTPSQQMELGIEWADMRRVSL